MFGFPLWWCHYTKSNPIDDHSNISSKKLQKQNFKPLGMWYLPFTKSPRKHTVTYHFSDLQEVYSGNRQIHTKCQLQYFHPPHISTSGKCHCVIIHQTTKATEYTGYLSKYLHKSPLSHICTNHSLRYIHSVNIWRCTSNSDLAITWFGAMPPDNTSLHPVCGYFKLGLWWIHV